MCHFMQYRSKFMQSSDKNLTPSGEKPVHSKRFRLPFTIFLRRSRTCPAHPNNLRYHYVREKGITWRLTQ
nr:MAG TPA: hypothetical protein [Caudoviricetes sp.]